MASRALVALTTLAISLLSFSSNTSFADEPQYNVIPDQYIIRFRDEISRDDVLRITRRLTAEHRLQLRHMYRDSIKGFSAEVPPGVLDLLRQHPDIISIEPNGYWYLEGDQPGVQVVITPTDVTATPQGQTAIEVTWTDLSDTEIAYEVARSTTGPGGTYTTVIQSPGVNVTSYTDTNVVANQQYCYIVRVGESAFSITPFSDPGCATIVPPPPTIPAAPTGLVATTFDDQRIDISWNDQSDNETGFRIERSSGSGGTFSEIDLVGANVSNFSDTGLPADSEFCYRVRAYNSAGDSSYTNVDCATTDSDDPPPPPPPDPLAAPTDLTATPVGETSIELNWVDNATTEVGFEVQRSTSGIGGPYVSLAGIMQPNATTYTDATVVAGNEYCYIVRAGISAAELGPFSDAACATAGTPPPSDPPSDPTGLNTTPVNDQRIDLSWTDTSNDEDGFEVERALGVGGTFSQIAIVGANVTNYSDTGRSELTEYCYRVRAFNSAGDSGYTATSCATTPEAPPPGACSDTGNHDDLTDLWGITQVKANLNATWQATQTAGCEITPWYFGLDSGVDSDHPDLNVVEIMGFIAADPSDDGEDGNGHGTHTAGTAAAIDGNGGVVGVAPGAPVYGFKVCGDSGSCAIDDIIAGVDEVTSRKLANPDQPMVANMSLGGGANSASDTAVRRSVNAGVVYSLSAGNGSLGSCIFPANSQNASPARVGDDAINAADGSDGDTARINGAITVTSSNQSDSDVNCNFGAPVTVAAPGSGILSTYLNGGYATLSGTSMAAPHVAGAAILYLQRNPTASPTEVEQAIVNELDPWTTNDTPNADGRLDAEPL